jgi:hypothetical protein
MTFQTGHIKQNTLLWWISGTDVIGWFPFNNTTECTAALITITSGTLYLSTLYSASQHICKLNPVCYFSKSLMQHVFMSKTTTLADMSFWTSNITSQYGCGSDSLLQILMCVAAPSVIEYWLFKKLVSICQHCFSTLYFKAVSNH